MPEKRDSEFDFLATTTKSFAPTTEQRVVYLLNGALVSLIPLYLYLAVFGIDYKTYAPVLAVLTVVSSVLLSLTYHKETLQMKNKLLVVRGNIKPSTAKGVDAKPHQVAQARKALQSNVITHESIAYSILLNNTIFLLSVVILAFYVFPGTASGLYPNIILQVPLFGFGNFSQ